MGISSFNGCCWWHWVFFSSIFKILLRVRGCLCCLNLKNTCLEIFWWTPFPEMYSQIKQQNSWLLFSRWVFIPKLLSLCLFREVSSVIFISDLIRHDPSIYIYELRTCYKWYMPQYPHIYISIMWWRYLNKYLYKQHVWLYI